MKTFIEEIASKVYNDHQEDLGSITVIFPNRRAGLFFRKALGSMIKKPIWMPRITSFEDFILRQSDLEKIENIEAVFLLYEVFKDFPNKEEPFDKFYFWGEMILRDFDEIDQYLVDADKIFKSIKTQKELEAEFYFLSEEDMQVIQSFWMTFIPDTTKTQKTFLETWRILNPVYEAFRKRLLGRGQGYIGMIYRDFLEKLRREKPTSQRKLLFAGFNALTKVEEEIIKHYVDIGNVDLIWDVDAYYLDDERQEAGFFLREYRQDAVLGRYFPKDIPNRISSEKEVSITGVSLEVGQAKAMSESISELIREEDFDPQRTVVVLPQEHMLFPILHSLTDEVQKVNVTMGYPISETTVFNLVENLLLLQSSRRDSLVHGSSFYYKPVFALLRHPLLHHIGSSMVKKFLQEMKKRNLIFVYHDELPSHHHIFQLIFDKTEEPLYYLLTVLKELHKALGDVEFDIDKTFISGYYEQIENLNSMIGERTYQLSYNFLIKLFRRMSRSIKVPFTGEPLEGLQIMGILETRNLDFENVFILNMNEDSWPGIQRRGSFIPYNIRKAFDIPAYEHQDAIYSYLFYRLLQRSRRIEIFHNIVSEFNINGELSRFVQQLEFESNLNIKRRILANPIKVSTPVPIIIDKDKQVMEKLNRYLVKKNEWTPRLTPSALDTYLYCRLRFYFKYVEQLYEPDELLEELDPMVFGNILHDTMEILYKQFIKTQKRDTIEPNDFFWLEGGIDGAINKAFIQHYNVKNEKKFKLEGRNVIAAEILRKTAFKILNFDRHYAPFKIIGLETSTRDGYTVDFPIDSYGNELIVGLKGKIDRIDAKDGIVRVLDYKTGKDSRTFTNIDSLIDRDDEKRNKAAFQVFFYSYLFTSTYKESYNRIEPGLYNSRDLFNKDFNWQLQKKENRAPIENITNFDDYSQEFERILNRLLLEIWDKNLQFDQVEDEKKCKYCSYKEICNRGI